jgi:hypothetical protein
MAGPLAHSPESRPHRPVTVDRRRAGFGLLSPPARRRYKVGDTCVVALAHKLTADRPPPLLDDGILLPANQLLAHVATGPTTVHELQSVLLSQPSSCAGSGRHPLLWRGKTSDWPRLQTVSTQIQRRPTVSLDIPDSSFVQNELFSPVGRDMRSAPIACPANPPAYPQP